MRRALAAAAAIGALAVVAFFVAVPIVIDRNLSAEAVAARGSALLGSPVTVGSVGVAFVPALRIRAEDVAAEGVGSAEAVEVEIAILPLLWRRVEVVELHLRRPRLLLVRGPDGAFRLRLLHAPGRAGGPGGPADLPELEARDGELVAVEADGAPTGAPVLHVERLELGRTLLGRHAALRLDVSLDPGDDGRFGVGRLALRGAFERTAEGVALREARAEGRDLRVRGLRFPSFEGRFDYEAGRARISELSLAGYDGSVSLAGTLRSGQPARFAGHFEARGLSVAAMVEDWRGRPLDHEPGVLDAAGDVDLRLARPDRGTGTGELSMVDGRLPAGSVFSALLGTLGRLTGQILSLGGAVAPAPSELERLSASWTLGDDRLHSEAVSLVTDDYEYRAAGSLGLDGGLDLSGVLQLTSRGVQRMLASGALPLPTGEAVIPAVPVSVRGPLGSPSVTASATGLPGAARATLGGLVRGGGGIVKGAAEGGKAVVDQVLGR